MNTGIALSEHEMSAINGGDSGLTVWGEQAAQDGLHHATNSGGNLLVMAGGTVLAAAGGWAWAIGSAYDGVSSWF